MINHEKAYLIGLLVGGGTISNDTFLIKLPLKKWGTDPQKMNKIAYDVLTKIDQKFQKCYNISVTYEIGNKEWSIIPVGKSNLQSLIVDLRELSLPTNGFLLNTVDLSTAKEKLYGVAIESFLTGIFDARASLTLSHRRFNSQAPVVSIEIPGSTKNFRFVVQFCSWLTSLGSITDQILFNHPNQHSASDPNYKGWKKGFKIRFLVKSFIAKHSFALQAKAIDVDSIEKTQKKSEQKPCVDRKIRKPSPVCIHSDIDSLSLPIEVRNRVFFHYFHFCAQFGCPFAPKNEVMSVINKYDELIFFLPRLEKGSIYEVLQSFNKLKEKYFLTIETLKIFLTVKEILDSDEYKEYYELQQAIAFLLSLQLNGKRHIGSMGKIINSNEGQVLKIFKFAYTRGNPIVLINEKNQRAALISSLNGDLNQRLIKENIIRDDLEIIVI